MAIILSIVLAAASGCSESVMIRSGPSGANVSVNNVSIGRTPVEYSVPRGDLDEPHQVRIERSGYAPATTTLQTRLAKGRVTGAVFTLGILWMFRSMDYIQPVFIQLEPIAAGGDGDRQVGEALRNLQDLYDNGKISEDELHRRQQEMLRQKQGPQ